MKALVATLTHRLSRTQKALRSFIFSFVLLALTTSTSYAAVIVDVITDTITRLDVQVYVSYPETRLPAIDIVRELQFWDVQIQFRRNSPWMADDRFFGWAEHLKHPRTGGPPPGPEFRFSFDNWYPVVPDPSNPGSFIIDRTATIHGEVSHPPVLGKDKDLYKVTLKTMAELPITIFPGTPPSALANYLNWSMRVQGHHVPEPPSSALFGIGIIGLLFLMRRRDLLGRKVGAR